MAAGVGSKVESQDYNQIQTVINNVLGVGSGDSGYGQTVTSNQVAQHSIVSVTQWNSLRNDLLKARQHQSGVDESGNLGLPTLDIRLSDADRSAYLSMATLINANRTITPPSGESSFVTLITANRSSGWTSTVDHTTTIDFGSANKLRWFFNSGGNFQFSSSLTNYQTSGDSAQVNSSWETLLRTMGIIKLSNSSTTNTGSGTSATNIGYANLTTSNQLIFTKIVESTLYTPNQYQLYARISGGSLIITPTWSYTDAGNDGTYRVFEPVTGTLNSFFQMYIATGSNVAVAYPFVQFSGSGWTYSSAYADPPPSYSLRPNVTLIDEGGTVTYTVATANVTNGTVLYWKNIGTSTSQDFTDGKMQDTVTIMSNSASITRQVRSDLTTEGNETVILQLLTGLVATATDITFITPGTYSWTCPTGVTSVSIVAIGAGSAGGSRPVSGGAAGGATGGGGGGLAYINNYAVTPGQSYTVVVGRGGNTYSTYQQYLDGIGQGDPTYFAYLGSDIIRATAGIQGREYNNSGNPSSRPAPVGGTWSGISGTVGYNGGTGGNMSSAGGGGGGGSAGYTAAGGNGGAYNFQSARPAILGGAGSTATIGAQGGDGGGSLTDPNTQVPAGGGGGGGGTGLFGSKDYSVTSAGGSTSSANGAAGADFGGGGGGHGVGRDDGGGTIAGFGGPGANGALRIVYGPQRTFPATNVGTSVIEYGTGVDSTILATADTVTISDTSQNVVSYTITPNVTSQNEGSPVVWTINTVGVTNGTQVWWINVGTTSTADFPDANNGSVVINNGTATITRSASADLTTEVDETIIIELHSGSVNGPLLKTSVPVTVVDSSRSPSIPSYNLAPASGSVTEGRDLIFYVTTSNVANGTELWWTIDTNSSDFVNPNGKIVIGTNAAQFTVSPIADSINESTESFTVSIRTGSISGQQVAFSNAVIADAVPTYAVSSAGVTSVNEGSSITFTVTTTNIPTGTSLNWALSNTSDFATSNGTVIITTPTGSINGSGTFSVTPTADSISDSDTFTASVYTGSITGTAVATIATAITINDTSQTPSPPVGPPVDPPAPVTPSYTFGRSAATVDEGQSFTITFTTNQAGNFAYTVTGVQPEDFSASGFPNGVKGVVQNGTTLTYTTAADAFTEGTQTFTISLDDVSGISTQVTINDSSTSPPPTIVITASGVAPASALPYLRRGETRTVNFTASGGTAPYRLAFSGTPPLPITSTFGSSTATYSGNLATIGSQVDFTYTVVAVDANGFSANLTQTVRTWGLISGTALIGSAADAQAYTSPAGAFVLGAEGGNSRRVVVGMSYGFGTSVADNTPPLGVFMTVGGTEYELLPDLIYGTTATTRVMTALYSAIIPASAGTAGTLQVQQYGPSTPVSKYFVAWALVGGDDAGQKRNLGVDQRDFTYGEQFVPQYYELGNTSPVPYVACLVYGHFRSGGSNTTIATATNFGTVLSNLNQVGENNDWRISTIAGTRASGFGYQGQITIATVSGLDAVYVVVQY